MSTERGPSPTRDETDPRLRAGVLERLLDATPGGLLPGSLKALYDGGLSIETPRCYGNFVSSVDGVVAVEARRDSGAIISGRNQADRFVMGLLRAFADAVLVGAGTVRAEGKGARWTPEFVYPAAAADFGALRRQLGLTPTPRLVILTRSGDLDPERPAIQAGPIIMAPDAAAGRLRRTMPAACEVIPMGDDDRVDLGRVIERLRAQGYRRLLSEGGPTTFGALLRDHLVDELFLTVSPVLAGRDPAADRLGLVEHAIFVAGRFPALALMSVRRSGSHLFLRYGLR
ncbi:MAG TPA: dihydrofolate reductase family protein [Candidatus Limnocylindrales bacterium]|nr:dihydrofolate reductase family protein [Candidatus Limnocylindrales bacterium]